jgi:alpha-tubulin suppressor-like RCC1 family protein
MRQLALALAAMSTQIAIAATTDLVDVVQLDVGGRHACAVTSAGAAKCWGDNTNGILGDGTTTARAWAGDVMGLTAGVTAVTTSRGWDAMNPDVAHTCALMSGGIVRCWGDNQFGQLGVGTTTGFAAVPAAPVALSSPAVAISAGWGHTCALLSDGTVECWGYNRERQLGDTTTVDRSTPVPVAGLANVVQISAGPSTTCALTSAGGVKCWTPPSITPPEPVPPPSDIAGMTSGVASVSSGGSKIHSCVLSGFGSNVTETCQKVLIGTQQGESHICAAMVDGAIRCIGANEEGQLGDGTTTPGGTGAGVSGLGSGGMQVSAAGFLSGAVPFGNPPSGVNGAHSCAVTTAGTVKCWGRNYCGLLGNGGTADCDVTHNVFSATPVDVAGISNAQSVSAGGEFACALTTTGAVRCWGVGYGATPLAVIAGTPPAGTAVSGTNARLGNISTRARVLTGNDVVIAGFVIGGSTSKTIAIQAIGPALTSAGIATPLANPSITLVRSSDQGVVATNDNWTGATNASQVQDSGFAPTMSAEPAIVATLAPGAYTAIVSGADGGTGSGVVGIFELDHPEAPLINISTRAQVLTGNDVMIAGFVVQGASPQKVAVTVAGPSLRSAGITDALGDPMLTLVRQSDGAVIASNDNWQAGATAPQLQAAGFAPASALEPGVLLSLDPGAYTVIVQGVSNTTGVAVVGVFAVP